MENWENFWQMLVYYVINWLSFQFKKYHWKNTGNWEQILEKSENFVNPEKGNHERMPCMYG